MTDHLVSCKGPIAVGDRIVVSVTGTAPPIEPPVEPPIEPPTQPPAGVTVVAFSLNQRTILPIPMVAGQILALQFDANKPTDGHNLCSIVGRGHSSNYQKYRFALSRTAGKFDDAPQGTSGEGQVDSKFAIRPGASPNPYYQSIEQGRWYLNIEAVQAAEGSDTTIGVNVVYAGGEL